MDGLPTDEERLTRSDSLVKKRVRHELDELVINSPDVKRLRDDLFDDSGHDPATPDLDSLMKSFEDELSNTTARASGETQPDLGYLFEASDDELGLPPPPPPPPPSEETKETELARASSDSSEVVVELCGFEEPVADFGSFELDDGLFEYSDVCLDSGDLFSWRPETLPAE
ncbi:hypothetical protein Bca4012_013758 [Brassica carinata]|uniref:Uncharacterized protein n=1 Tax=Brassica carinata TaxID=52824 RepID=A0A8X7Q069_BRACI|nr:hypothetical protein Bca52824_068578 [Brassica carinata]